MQPIAVRSVSIDVESPAQSASEAPVVLIVTADTNLREAAARALAREGYRVLTAAHSGHAVLACLQAGHVDVAAIELSMDDGSGPKLAGRLLRHCPEMRAVFFAERGTPEAEGFLVRPFDRDDLLAEMGLALVPIAL